LSAAAGGHGFRISLEIRYDRLYELKVPAGKREAAQRAVDTHEQKCPAATSVRGCIPITITADVVEE